MEFESLNVMVYYPTDLWFWIVLAVVVWYFIAALYLKRKYHPGYNDPPKFIAWVSSPLWLHGYIVHKYLEAGEK